MTPVKKVCVITGGTSGIGLCTAQAMLEKGYTVYELSRRAEGAPGMKHIMADVTKEETLAAAVQEILKQEDHIDVLINNAGFGISGAVEFTKTEDAQHQLDVNFFGMVRMNRQVLPVMRRQCHGRIVNLSSVAGAIRTGFTAAREKNPEGDDVYGGRIARSVAGMERDEQNGMAPEKAGAFIAHVADKKSVRPINTIGLQYKFFCFLVKILPAKTLNWLVGLIYAR